ncbi:MAG: hypothetical protein NZ930_04595 [Candidatus Bipolaricaulota bacterium]|nr:hypothetical protein [Candidatus Bipolaricaulota bacterium]MDW8030590.1 hypothetical protein [Candidatus Bipolaricaulota bacterium]
MKKIIAIGSLALVALLMSVFSAMALENLSRQHGFGTGIQLTFPMEPPHALPASGMSLRVWLADLYGVEANFFVVGSALSFTPRAFLKVINLEIADLYVGLGVSAFVYAPPQDALMLYTPLQGIIGLEMRLTPRIALNAELGIFGLGGTRGGVTSGVGLHFYF